MNYPPPAPPYVGPCSKSSAGDNKPIKRVVMHGTTGAGSCSDGYARRIATYFRSSNAAGSAHYVVDPGETLQTAYDSVICWHAPPNANSIGVELCDPVEGPLSRWDDRDHRRMLKRAARLVAELCLAYDVPVRLVNPRKLKRGIGGICEHSDVSEAFRQSSHWDLGKFPRRRFIRMVRAEVEAIKAGADVAKPVKETRVTKARDLLEAALRRTPRKVRRRRIRAGLDELPPH